MISEIGIGIANRICGLALIAFWKKSSSYIQHPVRIQTSHAEHWEFQFRSSQTHAIQYWCGSLSGVALRMNRIGWTS